jgi:hypothetical protein
MLAAAGCASTQLFGFKSVKIDKADAKNPAVEILALWQATEGPGPNGVPTRGFTGEVFFFTQAKPVPVMVEGKARIYLFDDHGTAKQQARPIREYDFDPASWAAHCHSSSLGPGYAVFIPYPGNDFHQVACSLRIRFTPAVGPTIYSPTATVVLSGPPAKSSNAEGLVTPSLGARQQMPQNLNGALTPAPGGGPLNAGQSPYGPATGNSPPAPSSRLLPEAGGLPVTSASRAGFTQKVVPVAGTDADGRLSLDDDMGAADARVVRPAQLEEPPPATQSRRIKLQSVNTDSVGADED